MLLQWYGDIQLKKKVSVDDKVHVAGIVITDSDVQQFLPSLTGQSLNGDHQSLDESHGRKAAGLHLLHQNFINVEVMVTIPEKWFLPATSISINRHLSEGVYKQHSIFNAHNIDHIKMP